MSQQGELHTSKGFVACPTLIYRSPPKWFVYLMEKQTCNTKLYTYVNDRSEEIYGFFSN